MIHSRIWLALVVSCVSTCLPRPVDAALIGPEMRNCAGVDKSPCGDIEFLVRSMFQAGPAAESYENSSVLPSFLDYPGGGYPFLGETFLPTQSIEVTLGNPNGASIVPPLSLVADPAAIDSGRFGAGQATLAARTVGPGGGVFWDDARIIDGSNDGASVSVMQSRGTATFGSTFPTLVIGGVWAAYRGTIPNDQPAPPSAPFAAVGIQGQFRLGSTIVPDEGAVRTIWVSMASDVNGPRDPYGSMHGAITQIIEFPDTNSFLMMGINFVQGSIPEGPNAAGLDLALTLIADPGTSLTPAAFTPEFLALVPEAFRPMMLTSPVGGGIVSPAEISEPSTLLLPTVAFAALLLGRTRLSNRRH